MSKGSNFESLIAKRLSLWITHGKRDDVLERNLGSGAKQTRRAKSNKPISSPTGDLSISSRDGVDICECFSIECKHYKNINLWSLVTGSADGLLSFWEQAKRDSTYTNRLPILMCRQNWKPILLVTVKEVSDILISLGVPLRLHSEDLYIFKLDDVLKVEYRDFIQKVREMKGA